MIENTVTDWLRISRIFNTDKYNFRYKFIFFIANLLDL